MKVVDIPVRRFALAVAFASLSHLVGAETVSWSWGCDDAEGIESNFIAQRTGNGILCTGFADSACTAAIEEGASDSLKHSDKYLKISPAESQGCYYGTIAIPDDIVSRPFESFTFSFDWAPSQGVKWNDQSGNSFGLAVHDKDGKALVTFDGNRQTSLYAYRGATVSEDACLSGNLISGLPKGGDSSSVAVWHRIVISGTRNGGVTIAVTNLNENAEVALESNSLGNLSSAPAKILVKTGYYSGSIWACVDEISFMGKTKCAIVSRYDFSVDSDQAILTNGYLKSSLFGIDATTNNAVNWTVQVGTSFYKKNDAFAKLATNARGSMKGMLVGLPKDVQKVLDGSFAAELSFDAMVQTGYAEGGSYLSGLVASDSSGDVVVTLRYGSDAKTNLYRGDTESDVLVEGVSLSSRSDPVSADCRWFRYSFRKDTAGAVRMTIVDTYTGRAVVEDIVVAAMPSQIALYANTSNNAYYGYAAIDNIKVYKYVNSGFAIVFQ